MGWMMGVVGWVMGWMMGVVGWVMGGGVCGHEVMNKNILAQKVLGILSQKVLESIGNS